MHYFVALRLEIYVYPWISGYSRIQWYAGNAWHSRAPRPKGKDGVKGQTGDKGSLGMLGQKGEKGNEGPRGESGPPGMLGIKGARGTVGDQGTKGDKGEKGESVKSPSSIVPQTNWKQCVWKAGDSRDSGKIKVRE